MSLSSKDPSAYPSQWKEFKRNDSTKNLRPVYIFCAALVCAGIILPFATKGDSNFGGIRSGVLTFSFALLCTGVVVFLLAHYTSMSPAVRYFVGPKGIVLKHLFASRAISYSEIENIIALTEKEAEAEILQREDKSQQLQARRRRKKGSTELSGDAGGMLSLASQAFSEFFSSNAQFYYFSVPRVFIDGPWIHRANIPCDIVLLKLKDGRNIFISPLDVSGFVQEAGAYMNAQ